MHTGFPRWGNGGWQCYGRGVESEEELCCESMDGETAIHGAYADLFAAPVLTIMPGCIAAQDKTMNRAKLCILLLPQMSVTMSENCHTPKFLLVKGVSSPVPHASRSVLLSLLSSATSLLSSANSLISNANSPTFSAKSHISSANSPIFSANSLASSAASQHDAAYD